ncbi:MAG: hypothetical protein A2138_23145 [Deltaproteobacteria bacterium RBG_16_71_12]|nr:MAG: hypothetical protein A2138_23145 [Deltaproteobacteria bacterium RBG_16_71_12]
MPIYEYICKQCQHGFEALVDSTGKAACPKCASEELDKQLSVFAAGKASAGAEPCSAMGGCGTCMDPRGPGACRLAS